MTLLTVYQNVVSLYQLLGVVPSTLVDNLRKTIDVALTISLHAPNDEPRDESVQINKQNIISNLD